MAQLVTLSSTSTDLRGVKKSWTPSGNVEDIEFTEAEQEIHSSILFSSKHQQRKGRRLFVCFACLYWD